MKPLNSELLEETKKMEKEHDTINPKEIWLRAWEIANERSKRNIYVVTISKEYEIEVETKDEAIDMAEKMFIDDFNSAEYGLHDVFNFDTAIKRR